MVKLRSFTLFESVIAVTIITVLIGMSTLIYGNLVEAEKPLAYYEGKLSIDRLLRQLRIEKNYSNRTISFETYEIVQNVSPYQGNKNLLLVEYDILTGTKNWWNEKHLVINEAQ